MRRCLRAAGSTRGSGRGNPAGSCRVGSKTPRNHARRGFLIGLVCAVGAPAVASAQDAGPLFATREEADAAFFVLERFLDGDASLEEIAELYADTVDYFALGPQPREKVLDFRRDFLSRWSERAYAPDLGTLIVQRDGERRFVVRIEVDFVVRNASARVLGRSLVDLTLERQGERLVIIREAGDVMLQE